MSSTKIPPSVARELKRHLKPSSFSPNNTTTTTKTLSSIQSTSSKYNSNTNRSSNHHENQSSTNMLTFLGCTAFVGITASIPYWAMQWIGPLNEKNDALTPQQIRRGAFNNSGSKDVGIDPMWDFKTGTRKKDQAYIDLFLKDNPNEIDHGDKFVLDAKRK